MRSLLIAAAFAACAGSAFAQTSASPSPAPDYTKGEAWLCLPGRTDACSQDLTTTVVAADGALSRETFSADPAAPVDCFYVYPTVSNDPTPNSDMTANAEEKYVIANQFARFGSVCLTYAPLYRQVTVKALRAGLSGQPMAADRMMAFTDVQAAWRTYLEKYNNGRGVILIGHSQGAGILTGLLALDIDGKPVQSQIVSAMILGSNFAVPRGATVGGVTKSMPLCTRADEAGCVVSYVTFRDTLTPPASSRFGAIQPNPMMPLPPGDMAAACVNPAALLSGQDNAPLHAYLSNRGALAGLPGGARPWAAGKTIDTPFVSAPGLLSARCVSTPTHTYLSLHVNADAADPRVDEIPGDLIAGGAVLPEWGMHLVDVNIAMGDLVALAKRQAAAYQARR
jgi:hypothetical protein